jgi:hypothetical protein
LVWLVYNATFGARWLWARNSVPGKLLVSTNSAVALEVLSSVFGRLRGPVPRLHQILEVRDLIGTTPVPDSRPAGPEPEYASAFSRRRPVAAAWLVHVRPGTEQAVLREIEYRVASEMAERGGYAGLGHRCLLAVGRAAIAATPVRRLLPSAKLTFPGPVEFVPEVHNAYKEMLRLGPTPKREVRVAVLDTNIQVENLPPHVRPRVQIVAGTESLESWTPFAHGAVTVSVIGDIAENARITLHPVLDDGAYGAEDSLLSVLYDIGDGKIEAEVVVLCLGLDPNAAKIATKTNNLDRAINGLAHDKILVVATGNSRNEDLEVLEPARRTAVFAIGAANKMRCRSWFSRYLFPTEDRPAVYMLAPGGDLDPDGEPEDPATVEGHGQRGSSVAAAYAAAVIVRSLGSTPGPQQRAAVRVALGEAAFALGPDSGAGPGCAGLIQEFPAGWHENVGAFILTTSRLPENVAAADAPLARPVGTLPMEEADLRDPALDIWVA